MRRFRFHLGTLVILVLLLGVGFAALRESNEIWDSSIFSITLAVLLISILLAIHRIGSRRAFWLGFAVFGSAYLGLTVVPSVESRLITTKALAYLASKMPWSSPYDNDGSMDLAFVNNSVFVNNSQPIALNANKGIATLTDVSVIAGSKPWFSNIFAGSARTGSMGTTEHFVRIGHSLMALIAAILGGVLYRHLHAKNREPDLGTLNPQA